MAYDCFCIDLKNKNSEKNIAIIKEKFPYVKVLPFVKNYKNTIDYAVEDSKTSHVWIVTSLCDYTEFDFDYMPEQFEIDQLHTWSTFNQKEGDTFLVPKSYKKQKIKFLRDYKDVNYHVTPYLVYDNKIQEYTYDLSNAVESLPKSSTPAHEYICYKTSTGYRWPFFPSYWDDLKIVQDDDVFYIPKISLAQINNDIYDYPLIYKRHEDKTKDCFDIFFISNGEPFEQDNFDLLQKHIKIYNLKNKLVWVKNIKGRSKAYKEAATQSTTEYFYAVFAKSRIQQSFMFDYKVDRCKSKRHYIFHSYLPELDCDYGTFNINLYNRTLCKQTDNDVLDFTLSKPHEVVNTIASVALLAPDSYTAWKNGFREVSKLVYWNNKTPTVETNFRIKKWLGCNNKWLKQGAEDGKKFTIDKAYDIDAIQQTYYWDFCRNYFKEKYPTETFY